uniref:Uncharacterized protein n=1 Tax=Hyaloperonospora arabidopsidis (strain Emoy2) TaxID=559515 RepID=M4BYV7_HYAAE
MFLTLSTIQPFYKLVSTAPRVGRTSTHSHHLAFPSIFSSTHSQVSHIVSHNVCPLRTQSQRPPFPSSSSAPRPQSYIGRHSSRRVKLLVSVRKVACRTFKIYLICVYLCVSVHNAARCTLHVLSAI